jgi:hypothetical protein
MASLAVACDGRLGQAATPATGMTRGARDRSVPLMLELLRVRGHGALGPEVAIHAARRRQEAHDTQDHRGGQSHHRAGARPHHPAARNAITGCTADLRSACVPADQRRTWRSAALWS